MILGSGLVQSTSWPKAPDWLSRDEFTDTRAAGSVNGTAATPGPGTRAVTDAESKLSVGAGVLAVAGGKASPAAGDPGLWYGAQSRATGLAQISSVSFSSGLLWAGVDTNTVGAPQSGLSVQPGQVGTIIDTSANIIGDSAPASGTYKHATVLRTAGALSIIKGSAYTDWTLLWVDATANAASVYPGTQNYSGVANIDYLRVIQLPAPFDTDTGLATDTHAGSVSAGTTFVHEADCLIEFTVTLPSSGFPNVKFRQPDASNFWYVQWSNTGTLELLEYVAGVPTSRATAAGVLSTGHRVVIVAEGTTIKGYSNNTLRWTYSSATNFATETAGTVGPQGTGGAVSDLITYKVPTNPGGLATWAWPTAVPVGTALVHEADFVMEFTVDTLPSDAALNVRLRKTDSTHYWLVSITPWGTMRLYERDGGSEIERAAAGGSVANGYRVVVIAEGSTIKGYSNNTLRWTYSSATSSATATAGNLITLGTGGAVSDLITWPRTLSGTAASILNKVSA